MVDVQTDYPELELLLFSEDLKELIQLRGLLWEQGASVKDARSLESVWRWMTSRLSPPSAVLINLTQETLSEHSPPIQFYKVIRQGFSNVKAGDRFTGWGEDLPVIFILPHDKLHSLEELLVARLGIFPDQFHTKPYNAAVEYKKLADLIGRYRRISLEELESSDDVTIRAGRITLSPRQSLVQIDSAPPVALPERELQLLRLLLVADAQSEAYVSYDELTRKVLGAEAGDLSEGSAKRTLTSHKHNLLRKLRNCSAGIDIRSVSRRGYRLIQNDDTMRIQPESDPLPRLTFVGTTKPLESFDDSNIKYTRNYFLRQPITTIGRQDCDLLIPLGQVSRKHAKIIEIDENQWCIFDAGTDGSGSTHGTVVIRNDARITIRIDQGSEDDSDVELRDGDLIEFGEAVVYRFSMPKQ